MNSMIPYIVLMRLNRPVGIFLLGWPSLMALWLAAGGLPDPRLIVIFILGTLVMRSLGCVINDLTDRPFDGHVQRTQSRPLVTGAVTAKGAYTLCFILSIIACILVLCTNWETVLLSTVALGLTIVYPWMKRFFGAPQLILGLAFSWAIPMAYMAQSGTLPLDCWLLFIATVSWTIAYDTLYAMADKADDLKIGVKSSALFFGDNDKIAVNILQIITIALFVFIGWRQQLNGYFATAIVFAVLFTLYQQYLIRDRNPTACFQAFLNHQWLGAGLFFGIFLGLH
jgi:4-hydroxybenzoate polyprenyltransferase